MCRNLRGGSDPGGGEGGEALIDICISTSYIFVEKKQNFLTFILWTANHLSDKGYFENYLNFMIPRNIITLFGCTSMRGMWGRGRVY